MYLALYRKWRPLVFDDVIAQPQITTPLKNQISAGKTAHAYLFTGSRGTGKTTCSKIFAKAVNCPNQKDGNPCLECEICKGIDDGSLLDVVEIDAASNNGVDNIRDIREEAYFSPAVCKYRVYIIDEVHMLSDGAFNALLKIMEEPPPHIIFILATTEVQKIPATILSRCQRYDFKRILSEDIKQRLNFVAKEEKINLDDDAALLIAKIADGGMRDALSLLDRCTAMSEHIDLETVTSASGLAGKDYLFNLTEAIISNDITEGLKLIDSLHSTICDLGGLCDELISHFRNILISKTVTKPEELIVATSQEIEMFLSISDRLTLDEILAILQTLQDSAERIKRTTAKRLEFEMALIKICSADLLSNKQNGASSVDIEFFNNRIKELENLIKQNRQTLSSAKSQSTTSVSVQTSQKKTEKIDYSKFTPVSCFAEIVEVLKTTDPALAGMIHDAKAYEFEDTMVIVTDKDLFSGLMRNQTSAEHFSDAVLKQTGKRYKFKIKSSSKQETTEQQNTSSPLDAIEKAAREAGVLTTE